MAPDDLDRNFERALAGHLRSGAAQPDCLDPELLAAYHERLLAPEQMMSCKQHIVSCARCQGILAQLEATDDLLVEADQQAHSPEKILTMPAPQEPPELVGASSGAAAAGSLAVPSRAARVAQSPWRSKTLHGANWRWLAPAGLLAAGLLIWISFHETSPSEFKLAKNTTPPAAPASAPNPSLPLSPAPRSSDTGILNKEKAEETASSKPASHSAAGPTTRADEHAATRQIPQTAERKQNEREEALQSAMLDQKKSVPRSSGALAVPSAPAVSAEPRARAERDADQSNLSAIATSADAVGAEQDKLMRKQPSAPAPPAPAIQKDDAVNAVAANAPPPSQSETQAEIAGGRQTPKKAKSEIAAGVSELRSAPVVESTTAMRLAKSRAYVTVTAPNSTSMWRFASAGLVEHSVDAGATWAVQVTGVVADLLAGSAPSSQICWVVGRSGTILRTTDGGSHWTKIRAPVTADLLAVFAVDDRQASVSITQASYQTMDGGRTWNKLLPE